jgi:hypothetical protein
MPAVPRHAKHKAPGIRLGGLAAAAAALAGVAAAFVFMQGGSAAARPLHGAIPATSAAAGFTSYQKTIAMHRDAAALEARTARRTALRRHLAAVRLAQQRAARRQARRAAAQPPPSPTPTPASTPTPTPTPTPAPTTGGGDAAHSALGICIRNAEEGGSYAWGPGNGGGAYQFLLGTWETYGGAGSEYGVAGPAYQDQIFDNAIAAGGASNWTNYDGC